jgi:hypothetical protein
MNIEFLSTLAVIAPNPAARSSRATAATAKLDT